MTARTIDGAALAKKIRSEVATRAAALTARGVKPGLAVVLVGENPASEIYVRNKVAACEQAGFHSVREQYPADLTEEQLLARIAALNADPAIHGILVQLPLPAHLNAHRVIEAIAADKDVDGFHVSNAGLLRKCSKPRTCRCAARKPSSSARATSSANPWRCCSCKRVRR